MPSEEPPITSAPKMTISGLSTIVARVLERLSRAPSDAELSEIHRMLATTSGRVEASLRLRRVSPGQLSEKIRGLRGWMAYFADREQFDAYVAALRLAQPVMEASLIGHARFRLPLRIEFRPIRPLYRVVSRRDGTVLEMPAPAICFGPPEFAVLASGAFTGGAHGGGRRKLLELMKGEAFQAIATELSVLGGIVEETIGQFHDLGASFTRVSQRYFNGEIQRPRLFWSRAATMRKFGHYDWLGGSLMVSRTLDRAEVPDLVVDFIMYHELLHQHHGIRWSGSRGYAHTAAFYRDERRFERHAEAEALLTKIAGGERQERKGR